MSRLSKETDKVLEFVNLTHYQLKIFCGGKISIGAHINVSKFSTLRIIRKINKEERIVIYNEEFEELEKLTRKI